MHKPKKQKLVLNHQTVVVLAIDALAQVAGGWSGRVTCGSVYNTCTEACDR